MAEKNFEVKLDRIELLSFYIKPLPQGINNIPTEFNFTITMSNKVIPEHKLIVQQVDIGIDVKEFEELSSISILVGYYINNFSEVISLKDGLYNIDLELEMMMRNISLGTSRGIYYSKLQGSYLQKAHLPIILTTSFENIPNPIK